MAKVRRRSGSVQDAIWHCASKAILALEKPDVGRRFGRKQSSKLMMILLVIRLYAIQPLTMIVVLESSYKPRNLATAPIESRGGSED